MPRDKTTTNAKIIQYMKEEFLTFGYEQASLNRVSAKVGITTAGLYKHFKSKEDMFYYLVKDALAAFEKVTDSSESQMETAVNYNPFDDDWALFWVIPLVMLHLGVMGMGVGIIISSLTTKYRDLSILVGFAVQLWMYITPVVYPLSQAKDEWLKTILLINPVTTPIEVYRYALLGEGSINPLFLIISFAFAVLILCSSVLPATVLVVRFTLASLSCNNALYVL